MSDPKRYVCPNCKADHAETFRARQAAWVELSLEEFLDTREGHRLDARHHLVDGRLTDDYFGPVWFECLNCAHTWRQPEIE